MEELLVVRCGQVPYDEARLAQKRIENARQQREIPDLLLLLEHPPVYTKGRRADAAELPMGEPWYRMQGIEITDTDRGGRVTYHGPGQLVGYPIFDLDNFFTDIHKYLRLLEEAIILTLAEYGIVAGRITGLTGVWLDHEAQLRPRKICAMGVKCSRWVTMHGFALNVNTDLDYFNYIVPCGITDKAVTSMQKELGYEVPMAEVEEKVVRHLAQLFEAEITVTADERAH